MKKLLTALILCLSACSAVTIERLSSYSFSGHETEPFTEETFLGKNEIGVNKKVFINNPTETGINVALSCDDSTEVVHVGAHTTRFIVVFAPGNKRNSSACEIVDWKPDFL